MRKSVRTVITDWSEVPIAVDIPYTCMILGVTPDTVWRKIKSGEIRAAKVGREWRITKNELRRILGDD